MDEDKKLASEPGRFEVGRKRSTVGVIETDYEMEEEDFIKTMRQALSVPPMPRKAGKKVQPAKGAE